MRKTLLLGTLLIAFIMAAVLTLPGCDKERIVTNIEKVQEIEYIELPPDTVLMSDTVYVGETVYDTVVVGGDTVYITTVDTVQVVSYQYDTTVVTITETDTVTVSQCDAKVHFAYAALHAYGDIEVLNLINAQYGYNDGWMFYLSIYQNGIDNPSDGVYDFYGFIDYWAPDWSEMVPLEYGFRLTYNSGDASDPNNWTMSDAPGSAISTNKPGIHLATGKRLQTNR